MFKRKGEFEEGEGEETEEAHGQWTGSSSQRRRRDLVSRACEPCRRSKTKCDEQRPCSRCTARRTISQCLGKVPLQSVNGFVQCAPNVERPLAYEATHTDTGARGAAESKSMWDMLPTVEAGWSDEAINHVFEGMPNSLRMKLLNNFRTVDHLRKQSLLSNADKPPSAESSAAMTSIEGIERQMWNSVASTGVMQLRLDPITGMRKSLFMNQRFASIFGYHREELLTRMVQREVPMAMSHIEFVCLMLDEVVNATSVASDRIVRICSEMSEGPVFAKHLQHKLFDKHGRLLTVTLYFDAVDVATFDQLREQQPAITRPFAHHLGDVRTGEELLAQARADLEVTINDLDRSSESGMRLVQELDHLVSVTFEPFMMALGFDPSKVFHTGISHGDSAAAAGGQPANSFEAAFRAQQGSSAAMEGNTLAADASGRPPHAQAHAPMLHRNLPGFGSANNLLNLVPPSGIPALWGLACLGGGMQIRPGMQGQVWPPVMSQSVGGEGRDRLQGVATSDRPDGAAGSQQLLLQSPSQGNALGQVASTQSSLQPLSLALGVAMSGGGAGALGAGGLTDQYQGLTAQGMGSGMGGMGGMNGMNGMNGMGGMAPMTGMGSVGGMGGMGMMDSRGMFMPSMLLPQGSAMLNPAELVRQGSNIGELARQGSLGWQAMAPLLGGGMGAGMPGGARPELLRSDTELSFSMVW